MPASRVRKHEPSLLEDLRYAVHGLCAPFACGGTLVPDQPLTLCFQDQTQLPVLRAPRVFEQEQLLQPLVRRCTPASFGQGRRTRYDRSVRNALQLNALTITHIDCLSVWPRASPRPAMSNHAGHATRSARQASRPSDD